MFMGHRFDIGQDGDSVKVLMTEMKRELAIHWEDKMAECCDEELSYSRREIIV